MRDCIPSIAGRARPGPHLGLPYGIRGLHIGHTKLTAPDWLLPGCTHRELRHTARWLAAALLPGLISIDRIRLFCQSECVPSRRCSGVLLPVYLVPDFDYWLFDIYWLWQFLIVSTLKSYIGLMIFISLHIPKTLDLWLSPLSLILVNCDHTHWRSCIENSVKLTDLWWI